MEALSTLGHFLLTLVVGLLLLTVLVYVHELGHYLVAKWCGMRVNAFAIFMGGVRKTDLYKWLDKPLAPSKYLWSVFSLSVVAAVIGALASINVLYLAGLLGAGVGVPVWAMLRLAALYHVPTSQVVSTLIKSLVVAAIVLALGTKLRGIDANMIVGVAAGATLIALAIVYYLPVQMHEQIDDKQGYGHVEVKCGVDGALDKLPVRYRPIWHRTAKDGTEFSLLMLPLGGFASIAGMHPKPDGSEANVPGGFYSKPPLKRLAVLFAGPLFSVLFGLFLLTGLYSVAGVDVPDNRPVLGYVAKESGADAAGLVAGDEILEIDGVPITDFYAITENVRDNWKQVGDSREPVPTVVTYRREATTNTVTVIPSVDDKPEPIRVDSLELSTETAIQARLGVGFGMKREHLGFTPATEKAVAAPLMMVSGLVSMVVQPATAADNVAGPSAMAGVTSAAVREGLYYVVSFAALLSISLGVMNLLPIVPLDGGQMVVAFVELLRGGRRLSIQVQNILANSGIALLILMMLAVSAVDLGRSAQANQKTEQDTKDSSTNQPEPRPKATSP